MAATLVVWGTKDLNTSAQLVLAKRLGFFGREGLDVQCKLFPSEEDFAAAFDKAAPKPFAWAQTVPEFLRLRAKGFPVKILAPLAEVSASYQVVLREQAGIILPADFEGQRVGMVRGSLIEVAFRNMAKDFDVQFDRIEFVHATPMRQLELFVNGEIAAVASWEPWTSQARYMGGTLYFSGLYSHIPGYVGAVNWLTGQSLLVTCEDQLATAPDQLRALMKALYQATTYLKSTMQRAAAIFSDLLGMENEELVELLQKNIYTMKMDDLFLIGLHSVLDLFRQNAIPGLTDEQQRQITSLRTPESFFETRLLGEIDRNLLPSRPGQPSQTEGEILTEGNVSYCAHITIPHRGPQPLRYLIVDDTQIVIDMFTALVEMLDGEVAATAATGAEALVQYVEVLPDIVVMDISMPDMNGLEAIKSILQFHPQANIFIISGNNYAETRREVFALGGKVFIGKPFHVEHLTSVLKKLLA